MQKLTVDASTNEVAQGLFSALAGFYPEIVKTPGGGYQVVVALGGRDAEIIAILSALERHVTERGKGPAKIDLEGRSYTLHEQPELPDAAGEPTEERARQGQPAGAAHSGDGQQK